MFCVFQFSVYSRSLDLRTYTIKLSKTTLQGQPCFAEGIRARLKTNCYSAVMSFNVGVTVETAFDCLDFNVFVSMAIVVVTKSCVQQ